MTSDEMRAFAQALVDGGPAKKAEILAFMRAFLDVDIQAGGKGMTTEAVEASLPALAFEITKTESGIHVPREANRAYSKREGAALVAMLVKALK